MAKLNRFPLQVSPEFKKKLDEMQKMIMISKGEKKSYRELTTAIVSSPIFTELEKNIVATNNKINMDIKIKLDRRLFR
jgi:hypothetical protein